MKLDKQQIEEIIYMKNKNIPLNEIMEKFKISRMLIYYYSNPEYKKRIKEYQRKWYNSLSIKERRKLRSKMKEYQRNYHNNLYKTNEKFRKKQIERSKIVQKRNNDHKNT